MRQLSGQVNVYDMFLSRKSDSSLDLSLAGQIFGYVAAIDKRSRRNYNYRNRLSRYWSTSLWLVNLNAVYEYSFTLDALALKPTDFCNIKVTAAGDFF